MTDRYGVIGHPIAHSKSPVIHNLFASQTDQDISYEAFDIAPDTLSTNLYKLIDDGIKGLNVTVPLKNDVAELMNNLSDRALVSGAVNTVEVRDGKLTGDNTDGVGLIRDLHDNLKLKLENSAILTLSTLACQQFLSSKPTPVEDVASGEIPMFEISGCWKLNRTPLSPTNQLPSPSPKTFTYGISILTWTENR